MPAAWKLELEMLEVQYITWYMANEPDWSKDDNEVFKDISFRRQTENLEKRQCEKYRFCILTVRDDYRYC